jgi:hypothetical protein
MNSSVRILCFAALGVAASAAFLNVGGKAEGAAGQEAKSAAPANEPGLERFRSIYKGWRRTRRFLRGTARRLRCGCRCG